MEHPISPIDLTLGVGDTMIPFILPLLASVSVSPIQVLGSESGTGTKFQTWCGKYYEIGSPQIPPLPESRFSYPTKGEQRLLDFKCLTATSIYLPGDDELDPPGIIFDAEVTYDIGQPGRYPHSRTKTTVFIESEIEN